MADAPTSGDHMIQVRDLVKKHRESVRVPFPTMTDASARVKELERALEKMERRLEMAGARADKV